MLGSGALAFKRALGLVCATAVVSLSFDTAVGKEEPAKRRRSPAASHPSTPSAPSLTLPKGPVELPESSREPGLVAYPPPKNLGPSPVTVFLHGMCDEPQNECPSIAGAATQSGWLVCPRATLRCGGGGSTWPFDGRFERSVRGSVARLNAAYPGALGRPDTLVGFSLGAIRAAHLLQKPGHGFTTAVLIGAKFELDPRRLRAANVERIVLTAGDRDMMKWRMVAQAQKLRRAKFPVAFMSLGKVGHWFPDDMEQKLARALAWVHGDDAAFQPRIAGELIFLPERSTPARAPDAGQKVSRVDESRRKSHAPAL